MKKCRVCGIEKTLDLMVKNANSCKECKNKTRRTGKLPYRWPKGILSSPKPFIKGHEPWNKGKKMSLELRKKLRQSHLGKKLSPEHIAKLSGRKPERRTNIKRWSVWNREWAIAVKERDKWTCQHCGLKDKEKLQAHHIVPWEKSIELRFDINNGITLCKSCHSKEDRRIGEFNIGSWSKGRKFTEEHKEKLRSAKIGYEPWNKGKKGLQVSPMKGKKGKSLTEDHKIANSKRTKGKKWIIDPITNKRKWILD